MSAGRDVNVMAWVGFGLGVFALFFNLVGVPSILAIVFSVIGLHQSGRQAETRPNGRVVAAAGLVMGILTFGYLIVRAF